MQWCQETCHASVLMQKDKSSDRMHAPHPRFWAGGHSVDPPIIVAEQKQTSQRRKPNSFGPKLCGLRRWLFADYFKILKTCSPLEMKRNGKARALPLPLRFFPYQNSCSFRSETLYRYPASSRKLKLIRALMANPRTAFLRPHSHKVSCILFQTI